MTAPTTTSPPLRAADTPTSRNAWWVNAKARGRWTDAVLWVARCPRCGEPVALASDGMDDETTPTGKVRLFRPHCCNCGNGRHTSCLVCGQCMPDWAPHRWYGGPRADKRYCSNACRQRAYRDAKRRPEGRRPHAIANANGDRYDRS